MSDSCFSITPILNTYQTVLSFMSLFHEFINLSTTGAPLLTVKQTMLDPGDGNLFNVLLNFASFFFFYVGKLKSILCSRSSKHILTWNDFPSLCVFHEVTCMSNFVVVSLPLFSPVKSDFWQFKMIPAELCPRWHFLSHFFLTVSTSSKLWNDSSFLVPHLYLFSHLLMPFSITFWVSFSSTLGLSISFMTKTSLVLRLLTFLWDSKLFLFHSHTVDRITHFILFILNLNLDFFQFYMW